MINPTTKTLARAANNIIKKGINPQEAKKYVRNVGSGLFRRPRANRLLEYTQTDPGGVAEAVSRREKYFKSIFPLFPNSLR